MNNSCCNIFMANENKHDISIYNCLQLSHYNKTLEWVIKIEKNTESDIKLERREKKNN